MIEAIEIGLASLYVLWVLYLAIMSLQRAHDAFALPMPALILGFPLLLIGWMLDILVNWVLASLIFWELPVEKTLSERLQRLARGTPGWRKTAATWVLKNLLSVFDPSGRHNP